FWASVVYFHLRLISTKSHKGEMTRNQFGSNPTRVRIPPAAPGKGLEPDRAPGFFFFRVRKTRAADLYRSAALVLLQQKDGVNQALRGICMAGGIVKIQRALRQSVGLQIAGPLKFCQRRNI
ncbi:hypothetical protein, partial [Anaerotruncus colihominis]|uniref:hypothetical protein n=1 Tax=Anaerotruncus colihominis TaxID=169435 RepID=UPI00242DD61B